MTVSLDSLLRHRFEEMTRRDALERVFRGIRAAENRRLMPVKINCVIIGACTTTGRSLTSPGGRARPVTWSGSSSTCRSTRSTRGGAKVVPSARILEAVHEAFRSRPRGRPRAVHELPVRRRSAGRARRHLGVTEPFDTCNRLRLTAEGAPRLSVRPRGDRCGRSAPAPPTRSSRLIRDNVRRKWSGHRINHPDFGQATMSAIGG